MKYILQFLILILPFVLTAQKSTPQVISNAGSIEENSLIKVSWTLGEFSIATIGSNPILTQGVQQSKLTIETKVETPAFIGLVKIFPNPTSDYIIVKIDDSIDELKVNVLDINGKIIFSKMIQNQLIIPMNTFPLAPYVLQITKNNKVVHLAKIIKIQ